MQPVNLVLSGGGVRGIAHLGVIKALHEHGVVLEAISGVSSGAMVGAFIAAGYSPEEALEIFKEHRFLQLIRPKFNDGLFSMKRFGEVLLKYFPHDRFERLNIPLIISASDLTDGHSDWFTCGELIRPLLASCSIPLVFEPVTIESDQLVDGGFLNNLPVEPFLEDDVTLIGVHVNPWTSGLQAKSVFQVMERLVALGAWHTVKSRKRLCDVFIEPPALAGYGLFDTDHPDELFRIGYEHTRSRLELLRTMPHSTFR
jgi:NTE family protein